MLNLGTKIKGARRSGVDRFPVSAAGNRLPVEDLMIAAIALANGHEVVTRDLRSFPRVPGLKWVKG